MRKIALPLLCCLLLLGCIQEKLPPDVVAEINGEYIMLREVEALHDVSGRGAGLLARPDDTQAGRFLARGATKDAAVEALRRKYGQSLTTLMVQKLMAQALAKAGMAVSDEDVLKAENEIRADYPDYPAQPAQPDQTGQSEPTNPYAGEFERALQEEYISLELWRDFLRLRLAQTRFQDQVLRPQIRISAAEARQYFDKNRQDFIMPGRVRVDVYAGISKTQMEKTRAALLAGEKPEVNANLTRQQLTLPLERLPAQWRQDIKETERGKPSPVRETDGLFQVLMVVDEVPARALTAVQAYPVIEQQLVEEKLEPVFWDWLEKTLKTSTIRVASALEYSAEPPRE